MKNSGLLSLAIALLMFPQFAQALYSPALEDLARTFAVSAASAAQVSVTYFLCFAAGVVVWGLACDRIGRRPAMILGLLTYTAGCSGALMVTSFTALLFTQGVASAGAAVGSVVTQTVLRDRFSGSELAKAFAVAGTAAAACPAVGLIVGAASVRGFGYKGALFSLLGLALALLCWCALVLPETRPSGNVASSFRTTCRAMLSDVELWRSALLVAAFNVALLSYYALGPFIFQRLHRGGLPYGYSGVLMAVGSSAGTWLNKRLVHRGVATMRIVGRAAMLTLLAGIGVQLLDGTLWFLLPATLVTVAFGVAIPNVLGEALNGYQDLVGTAGAVFGLIYYLLIGMGMALAVATQSYGMVLIGCAVMAAFLCRMRRPIDRTFTQS
ncbi:MFS transporter [Paraburkholderia sp. J41]|uniref:MFS transporter n=1 Tax=Paraburkholderia sp. J41 TaxID=2805433 RepID=UPI002AC3688B|nr:MFS transporter [Paraburkholderia sp. J41]